MAQGEIGNCCQGLVGGGDMGLGSREGSSSMRMEVNGGVEGTLCRDQGDEWLGGVGIDGKCG